MNKTQRVIVFLLFFLFTGLPIAFSQEISTQGTEFWVSFMGNGYETNGTSWITPEAPYLINQLMISSKYDCSGTITNPNNPDWSIDFTVEANNIRFIDIPKEQCYTELTEYDEIVNKGVFVQTTAPVSVYCANAARYSFDASYVLPIQALANEYIIQTYDQYAIYGSGFSDYYTSAFLIIATEEGDTKVDITPSVKTLGGHLANETYSVVLRKGEVYQVRSNNDDSGGSRDLSGTRVIAHDCKKIAVFNGNNLTMIPSTGADSDCIFEQAMPLQSWGRRFVITSSLGRTKNDYVKITSASDNNVILKNGQPFETLDAYESITFELENSSKSCLIQASHSCAVYLYNHSKDNAAPGASNGIGAPSMLWISPIEQQIEELTFSTFNDEEPWHVSVDDHYVNIIVNSEDAGNVTLDDNLINANLFEDINGTTEYKFCRREISHGVHHLSCPNGFNAHVYGFGYATGYAYMAGSNAADLSTTLIIDDVVVNHNDTLVHCDASPVTFEADINISNYDGVVWDFGDGTTSTSDITTHTYEGQNIYEASFTVTTLENPCTGSTSATTVFYIDTRHEADETYIEEICFKGTETYNEHGFNFVIDAPGPYNKSYTTTGENGCESTISLILNVNEIINLPEGPEERHCDSMVWFDHTYFETGHYADTTLNEDSCYTIHHLNLNIYNYTPSPSGIHPVGNNTAPWVIPATEFQINAYEFAVSNPNPQCEWDSVRWHFCKREAIGGPLIECDADINWRKIEKGPLHDTCKIYVLSHIDDTIWIRAYVYNECKPEGVSTEYWLVCSFYDIDEHEAEPFSFNVVPNPNQGQMELHFGKLSGPVDIKVYDMRGILVDQIKSHNNMGLSILPYDISRHGGGIYYFVAAAKEGTVARKVVVSP